MHPSRSNIFGKSHRSSVCIELTIYSAFALLLTLVNAGVPLTRFEAVVLQKSESELGLYNASDKVWELNSANFNSSVLLQNRSTLVEFYNSYCGHCKRFAPKYKELAEELYPWRDVLPICAINCAAEENNGICREYEILGYPTLRYFGPGYNAIEGNYGSSIDTLDLAEIRTSLAQLIAAENHSSTASIKNWPNFNPLTEVETKNPFEGLDGQRQFVVVVYNPENSTIGIETILHFIRWPAIEVRRVNDLSVAAQLKIDNQRYKMSIVDRMGAVTPYAVSSDPSASYIEIINEFLNLRHLTKRPEMTTKFVPTYANEEQQVQIINKVKQNKHFVYQADLEMAIHGVLYNEIPKKSDISGESLLALQRFLTVLKRYNPLGTNGRALIAKLHDYVMQFNDRLDARDFEGQLKNLETSLNPIFSAKHYVGCIGSQPGLRGFTCSLWQLFHFMSVQSAKNVDTQDTLEILQAMHGYIKNFFGCSDCSAHFQSMATRRKIWSVPNKDEAILWLWAAHNEVNQRLAGDSTEDPAFPKIQFPSQSSCPQCYKSPVPVTASLEISWDKNNVLSFLKNIHNPEYVSRYGAEHEDLAKIRQKRMVGNMFSDMDLRMGMVLYGFCVLMIIVAFKLFAYKGYRKKPYVHDFLGKV